MSIPIVLESLLLAVCVQLFLCFRGRKLLWKWTPLIIVIAADLLCWMIMLSTDHAEWLALAFTLAMMSLLWLAGIALAWGIYGIVKTVQKRK